MNKCNISIALLLAATLTACNSTESALNVQKPTAGTGVEAGAGAEPVTTAASAGATTPAAPTAPAGKAVLKPGKLLIAPIIGAPVEVVTPLTHRLNADAKTKGITLAAANDPATGYVMKGYFSALAENGETTVLYVWDVLDMTGNRLHRIQGQQKVKGMSADSWSAVPATAMEAIADKTMQEYASWYAANRA